MREIEVCLHWRVSFSWRGRAEGRLVVIVDIHRRDAHESWKWSYTWGNVINDIETSCIAWFPLHFVGIDSPPPRGLDWWPDGT
jgi:hypothetical protein